MSQSLLVPLLVVGAAGVAIAFQAPINAALGRAVGGPLPAAVISFAVGLIILTALTFATGQASGFGKVAGLPLWMLIGGALGALYVWAAIVGVAALGALTTVALVVFGQLATALILDHYGLFDLPVQEISPARILAVLLIAAGLVLSRF